MDRAVLEQHLTLGRSHIALGKEHLLQQHAVIRELEEAGQDTTLAANLLRTLEQSQVMHIADVDRLEKKLAELDEPKTP
jgi:hypothetical protein